MSLIQTILIILFAICSVLLFVQPESKRLKRILIAAFYVALLLVVVFRSPNMADYNQYADSLKGYGGTRLEPGFHIIKTIASILGNPAFWGLTIFGILSVSARFLYIIKYSEYIWGMLLVYMSNVLVTQDMIAIRAAVASSIIFFAIDYKFKKDWKKSLICLFFAVFFHYSAIACLVLFLLNPHKHYRWLYLSALIISHVMAYYGFNLNQYLGLIATVEAGEVLYNMYENSTELNVFNLLQIGHVLVCCFLWLFVGRIRKQEERCVIYLKLYTIGLCTVPLLAGMIAVATRLSELFLTVEIILIPIGFFAVFRNRVFGRLALLFYCIIIFYFSITNIQYWDPQLY